MMRLTILHAALLAAAVAAGCTGADRSAGGVTADGSAPAAAASPRTAAAADLPGFPMPAAPAGEDQVLGPIRDAAAADPAAPCAGTAVRRDGALGVNVAGLTLNCCTDEVRAGVERRGAVAVVRLYEYLRDPCECTHLRDLAFDLEVIEGVTSLEIILNDRPTPVVVITL